MTTMNRIFVGLALATAMPLLAADPPDADASKAVTELAKAGPDFAIQGEYAGPVAGSRAGAQVVAEGDGRFSLRLLAGGLPGDGWDGETQALGSGKTADRKTTFAFALPGGRWIKGHIADGVLIGTDENGRDLLARLMFGARISLTVALFAVVMEIVIGTLLGQITGLVMALSVNSFS